MCVAVCWFKLDLLLVIFSVRFPCVIRMSDRMLLAFFVIPASSSSSVRLSVGSTGRTWTSPYQKKKKSDCFFFLSFFSVWCIFGPYAAMPLYNLSQFVCFHFWLFSNSFISFPPFVRGDNLNLLILELKLKLKHVLFSPRLGPFLFQNFVHLILYGFYSLIRPYRHLV